MEPRGRYAETLILLAGSILGEGRALPKGAKIDEKTGPGKKPLTNNVFYENVPKSVKRG